MADRVIDIVWAAIQAAGADGLFNRAGECACVLADLAPASCLHEDCRIGRRGDCPKCGEFSVGAMGLERWDCPFCGAEVRHA
jgi:ribosomal protein S27AE